MYAGVDSVVAASAILVSCVDGMVCKDVCVAGESYLYRIAEIECTNDW